MNTTLTADAAVALPTPLPAARPRAKAKSAVLVGSAALGLLSAWAFDGGPLGLGFFLVTTAFAIVLATGNGKEGWQSGRSHRWLLGAAVLLAGFVAVRDSDLLVAMNVFAVGALLLLAVRGWNGELPVADVSLKRLVTSPFTTVGLGVQTGAGAIGEGLRSSRFSESWPRLFGPIAKMGLIGGPIVGLVTLLLASGDAAFGAQVESAAQHVIDLPLPELTRMGMVAMFTFTVATGLVTWAMRRRSLLAGETTSAPVVTLGMPEALAILGGLTVVLMLFSVVSARCAFAPDSCSLPKGVTYSSYAREGFWQLLTVAAIVLMTVLSVPHRAKATTLGLQQAVRVSASVLVAATLPMLLSAVNRMMLYEDAYGFTRQRVLSQVVCVFVGLLLVWRALTLWTWPHRFAVGVVAASVLVLTGFNAMNPDAFIARKNIERSGYLDVFYLRELSADAAPVLRAIPAERLEAYEAALFSQYRSAPGAVSSFNLARACDQAGGQPMVSVFCP
ncbi:MAG: DUF4173 domain-containing protein [Myxococcales bacterium]|nr:DUF4173 domain-containing protein [Myxococcales bacterium]